MGIFWGCTNLNDPVNTTDVIPYPPPVIRGVEIRSNNLSIQVRSYLRLTGDMEGYIIYLTDNPAVANGLDSSQLNDFENINEKPGYFTNIGSNDFNIISDVQSATITNILLTNTNEMYLAVSVYGQNDSFARVHGNRGYIESLVTRVEPFHLRNTFFFSFNEETSLTIKTNITTNYITAFISNEVVTYVSNDITTFISNTLGAMTSVTNYSTTDVLSNTVVNTIFNVGLNLIANDVLSIAITNEVDVMSNVLTNFITNIMTNETDVIVTNIETNIMTNEMNVISTNIETNIMTNATNVILINIETNIVTNLVSSFVSNHINTFISNYVMTFVSTNALTNFEAISMTNYSTINYNTRSYTNHFVSNDVFAFTVGNVITNETMIFISDVVINILPDIFLGALSVAETNNGNETYCVFTGIGNVSIQSLGFSDDFNLLRTLPRAGYTSLPVPILSNHLYGVKNGNFYFRLHITNQESIGGQGAFVEKEDVFRF